MKKAKETGIGPGEPLSGTNLIAINSKRTERKMGAKNKQTQQNKIQYQSSEEPNLKTQQNRCKG